MVLRGRRQRQCLSLAGELRYVTLRYAMMCPHSPYISRISSHFISFLLVQYARQDALSNQSDPSPLLLSLLFPLSSFRILSSPHISSHLISSHLISSHLISSPSISSHLISSSLLCSPLHHRCNAYDQAPRQCHERGSFRHSHQRRVGRAYRDTRNVRTAPYSVVGNLLYCLLVIVIKSNCI